MDDLKEGDKVVFFSTLTTKSFIKRTKHAAIVLETPLPRQKRIKIGLLDTDQKPMFVSKDNLDPGSLYPHLFSPNMELEVRE